jgi:hypothetical protein
VQKRCSSTDARKLKRWLIAVVVLVCMGRTCVLGQETRASLRGKVTDPNGAVVQNANVTLTLEGTRAVQKTKTNEAGDWRVDGLVPGLYDFDIVSDGFETSRYAGIYPQVGDQKQMDTKLRVGAGTESVNVTAMVPLIDTTSAPRLQFLAR